MSLFLQLLKPLARALGVALQCRLHSYYVALLMSGEGVHDREQLCTTLLRHVKLHTSSGELGHEVIE